MKSTASFPYPEGTAAAEVLLAAQEGGRGARHVFSGLGVGLVYSLFWKALKLWSSEIAWRLPFIKKAQVSLETSPALLGVGYILGFRIGTIMVCGAALSYLVIMPLIAHLWGDQVIGPATEVVDSLTISQMRNFYIRYIGAGAVASAGIITLIKSIPTMVKSFQLGMSRLRSGAGASALIRTDRDLSLKTVGFAVLTVGAVVTRASLSLSDHRPVELHASDGNRDIGGRLRLLFRDGQCPYRGSGGRYEQYHIRHDHRDAHLHQLDLCRARMDGHNG